MIISGQNIRTNCRHAHTHQHQTTTHSQGNLLEWQDLLSALCNPEVVVLPRVVLVLVAGAQMVQQHFL